MWFYACIAPVIAKLTMLVSFLCSLRKRRLGEELNSGIRT